jgi:hypothetical protein
VILVALVDELVGSSNQGKVVYMAELVCHFVAK